MGERIQSKRIKVGKLDIHYITGGSGDPLIIIHGGGEGARAWRKTVTRLTRNYCVYVPDLPGFGQSQPATENQDMSDFVEFIEDFATNLGLNCFHLIGHSFGSGIALRYALKFPKKITKLVLVNSIYLGKEIALWVRILSRPFFYKTIAIPAHSILEAVKWLVGHLFSPLEFRNPLPRAKMDLARYVVTLKEQVTVLMSQFSELLMPTLLVCGAKDIIVPVSQAYAAAKLIPNCQLKVFDDGGHNIHQQKSHEFSHLLEQFLD